MELTLTPKEADLLRGLLTRALSELRLEIQHTDRKAFKAGLKADEAALQGILDRLPALASTRS